MRSESLVRLDADQGSYTNSEARRCELNAQVNEFLARGGEIQVLHISQYDRDLKLFNRGKCVDPMSGRVLARASRAEVGGRMVVSVRYLEKLLNMSDTKIRNLIYAGKFPASIPGLKPMGWDEAAVLAWMAERA